MYQELTIVGFVGNDAEMRYTPGGDAVTTFNVATSRKFKNAQGGTTEITTWHRVTTWRKLAETCNEFVKKGDRVLVAGTVEARAWNDGRTGEPKAGLEVTAETVRFLGGKDAAHRQPTVGGATPRADDQHSTFVPASVDMMHEQEIPF